MTAQQSEAICHFDIGQGSKVAVWQVVAVLPIEGRAMRRLRDEAYQNGRLIDACRGVSAQSMIVTKSNHVIISALSVHDILDQQIRQEAGYEKIEPEENVYQ